MDKLGKPAGETPAPERQSTRKREATEQDGQKVSKTRRTKVSRALSMDYSCRNMVPPSFNYLSVCILCYLSLAGMSFNIWQ